MLCLASILLSQPYVVWAYGMYAVEVGLSLVLAVRVACYMARFICWGLYPLPLKTVVRNSSSQTQFILHIHLTMKMEKTECPETSAYKIKTKEITQKKAYNIQNKAKVWNQELFWCDFDRASSLIRGNKNAAARKPDT